MEFKSEFVEHVIFPILGITLGLGSITWFYQLSCFFKYLKSNHPEVYKIMGEPGFIKNNNVSNNIALLKFIFGQKAKSIGDQELVRRCNILSVLIFSLISTFMFSTIFIWLSAKAS
ncbi:hypothetical protein [Endozoicomonas sp.]|uniref:hypothetical protein n=1 Tax=Endozoicomonas sp. TaxID=1892382 RepID=UPI003AF804ED